MRACDNPFASDRVESVGYRPQGTSWAALMARLVELRYRAAIVGPHGSGKTTLMEELAGRLEGMGFETRRVFLNDRARRLPGGLLKDVTRRHVILIDGADQMPRLAWVGLRVRSRGAGGLVVTCHGEGMLPTLVETTTSAGLLREIVAELHSGHDGDVGELLRRHG